MGGSFLGGYVYKATNAHILSLFVSKLLQRLQGNLPYVPNESLKVIDLGWIVLYAQIY